MKRLEKSRSIESNFNPVGPLTIHWDTKLLPSSFGSEKVDRLPIVVTSSTGEQILGVPSLSRGTGNLMSKAVFEYLKKWNILELVRVMCFDTTSSNTGVKNGACTGLQLLLGRQLLYFACRHHIFEIVLEAAFSSCFGSSSGPEPSIFIRFKNAWSNLNKQNFKNGLIDPKVSEKIGDSCEIINTFALKMLSVNQPRDDYKELLELILIFTGYIKEPSFKIPGSMHHARWMAKAIYALKIFLFRNEFPLTKLETKSAQRLCVFVASVYMFGWFNASLVIEAPRNDLRFLKNWKNSNKLIRPLQIKSFHLIYGISQRKQSASHYLMKKCPLQQKKYF
ncbi:unnamed protein product [Brassicogethes aeneus]|uniref:Cc8K15.2-like protein n=1 Tax=Brassicogethes aeneus TaxID=1431903 RepID=A0A9P0BD68_BRAAE|nr:unnamed protein product [Brassicogethes aeneus]